MGWVCYKGAQAIDQVLCILVGLRGATYHLRLFYNDLLLTLLLLLLILLYCHHVVISVDGVEVLLAF